jgi:hypothetical protein
MLDPKHEVTLLARRACLAHMNFANGGTRTR